jgi:hypothetical protein
MYCILVVCMKTLQNFPRWGVRSADQKETNQHATTSTEILLKRSTLFKKFFNYYSVQEGLFEVTVAKLINFLVTFN